MVDRSKLLVLIFFVTIAILNFALIHPFWEHAGGDIRAHIFRILEYSNNFKSGYINDYWTEEWYTGYHFGLTYPPMFYYIGSVVYLIINNIEITYFIAETIVVLMFLFSIKKFASSIMGLSRPFSIVASILVLLSPPLMFSLQRGALPNVLGFSFGLLFVTFLQTFRENSFKKDKLLSGLFLGLGLLSHLYTVIYVSIFLVSIFLGDMVRYRNFKNTKDISFWFGKDFALIIILGLGISSLHTIPFVLSVLENGLIGSKLFEYTGFTLNNLFWYLIFYFALLVISLRRSKIPTFVDIFVVLNFLFIFLVSVNPLGFGGGLVISWRFLFLSLYPIFSLWIIQNLRNNIQIKTFKKVFVLFFIITLMINFALLNVIAKFYNVETNSISSVYWGEDEVEIFEESRLISIGTLYFSNSLLTFAPKYDYQTVTGSYSQGDSNFFDFNVYVEWQDKWLKYENSLENIMRISNSRFLELFDYDNEILNNSNFYKVLDEGNIGVYEYLLYENSDIYETNTVLLDTQNDNRVSKIFSLIFKDGYKVVMCTRDQNIPIDLIDYIITDDPNKIDEYPNKKIILLSSDSNNENIKVINIDMRELTKNIIYDPGDSAEYSLNNKLELDTDTTDLQNEEISDFMGTLHYKKVDSVDTKDGYIRFKTNSPVVIRKSYTPYWKSKTGEIYKTTDGQILYTPNATDNELYIEIPQYYYFGYLITFLSITAVVYLFFKNK